MQHPSTTIQARVAAGMLWATFGTVMSKCASLGAQLVLGWMLSTEDFGVYAIAIAWSAIVLSLRNGGTQRALIQQGQKASDVAGLYFKVAVIFNVLGGLMLAAAAPMLACVYEHPALQAMIWIIALALPLNTVALIFQAQLSATMDFAGVAKITTWSAILRHGSSIVFAWLGCGPLSFVLPLIVIAIYETAAGWAMGRGWFPHHPFTWTIFLKVFRNTRWIMFTSLANVLAINGDYLMISLFQDKTLLGLYFFGFQLSLSLAVLFTNGVESVMLPMFARLAEDEGRQRQAFLKSVRALMLASTLACYGLFLAAGPLVHWLWDGKWDKAVPVVQILTLSLPIRLMVPLCRTLIEGRGEWRLVSGLLAVDAIGTLIASSVGAWMGGLTTIAGAMSVYNVAYGVFICGVVARRLGGRQREMFVPVLSILGCGITALSIALLGRSLELAELSPVWQAMSILGIYATVYLGLTRLLMNDHLQEVILLLRRSRGATPSRI